MSEAVLKFPPFQERVVGLLERVNWFGLIALEDRLRKERLRGNFDAILAAYRRACARFVSEPKERVIRAIKRQRRIAKEEV